MEILKDEDDSVLAFKSAGDAPPEGSLLAANDSVLILQDSYQKELFEKHGPKFAGIDATHNVTYYKGMLLFTLIVRDNWGHG